MTPDLSYYSGRKGGRVRRVVREDNIVYGMKKKRV